MNLKRVCLAMFPWFAVLAVESSLNECAPRGGLPNFFAKLERGEVVRVAYLAMEELAGHYGIPSINLGLEVARLEKAGKLVFQGNQPRTEEEKATLGGKILFSPDAVHPYPDSGHQLYLEAVVRGMGL